MRAVVQDVTARLNRRAAARALSGLVDIESKEVFPDRRMPQDTPGHASSEPTGLFRGWEPSAAIGGSGLETATFKVNQLEELLARMMWLAEEHLPPIGVHSVRIVLAESCE